MSGFKQYSVLIATTYVTELKVEAESTEGARETAIDSFDPYTAVDDCDGNRLEMTDAKVTRVDDEGKA